MKIQLRILGGLAGALLLFLSLCSHGQGMPKISGDTNDVIMSRLNALIGRAALSLGDAHFIGTETMPGLLSLWRQRNNLGAFNYDLSNAFLFVMEENPKAFFSSMAGEPKVFSEWLKDLPDLSFTWFGNSPCRLEAKRKQLIMILDHTAIHDPKLSSLKNAVLARLSEIRCRQIQ